MGDKVWNDKLYLALYKVATFSSLCTVLCLGDTAKLTRKSCSYNPRKNQTQSMPALPKIWVQ